MGMVSKWWHKQTEPERRHTDFTWRKRSYTGRLAGLLQSWQCHSSLMALDDRLQRGAMHGQVGMLEFVWLLV